MIHKTCCGRDIYNEEGKIIISCGDDLGGMNGEFAQCSDCYKKDLEVEVKLNKGEFEK